MGQVTKSLTKPKRSWEHMQRHGESQSLRDEKSCEAQEASKDKAAAQALWPHRLHTLVGAWDLAIREKHHPICFVKGYCGCSLETRAGGVGGRIKVKVWMAVKQKHLFFHNLQNKKDTLLCNPVRTHTHTPTPTVYERQAISLGWNPGFLCNPGPVSQLP